MAFWHDRRPPATALLHCLICPLLVLTLLVRTAATLRSVAGSPCESICSNAGGIEDSVVCLDAEFQSLEVGRGFQDCVACQLNSTAVDTAKNETDVEYGLLALRYTLAGCMFAIPEPHISISSPCQVSCAPLNGSIGYQITNDSSTANPGESFCGAGQFDDATVNRCALCYSFIPQQLFLANFLQALHIACRQHPISGSPFFPDADAIFNETLIAGPTGASAGSSSGSGLHGWQLALAIALPIVGGLLLIGGGCWGCFTFTRRRRQRMAQTGRMSRIHHAYADSVYSPVSMSKAEIWGQQEPPREMKAISPTVIQPTKHSPGLAQGRWSHQTASTADQQGTPLRNSFQHDDVGPAPTQVRDPNLHEQYFGVAGDGDEDEDEDPNRSDMPGPSGGHPQYHHDHPNPLAAHGQLHMSDHLPGQAY